MCIPKSQRTKFHELYWAKEIVIQRMCVVVAVREQGMSKDFCPARLLSDRFGFVDGITSSAYLWLRNCAKQTATSGPQRSYALFAVTLLFLSSRAT